MDLTKKPYSPACHPNFPRVSLLLLGPSFSLSEFPLTQFQEPTKTPFFFFFFLRSTLVFLHSLSPSIHINSISPSTSLTFSLLNRRVINSWLVQSHSPNLDLATHAYFKTRKFRLLTVVESVAAVADHRSVHRFSFRWFLYIFVLILDEFELEFELEYWVYAQLELYCWICWILMLHAKLIDFVSCFFM